MTGLASQPPAPADGIREASAVRWKTLAAFNIFRLLTVMALLAGGLLFPSHSLLSLSVLPAFLAICTLYTLLALVFAAGIARCRPVLDTQLAIHVAVDVAFIVSIMHLMGGIESGLGLLLLPYLAAAGLIAQGRMTLFHASLAVIALLAEQAYQVSTDGQYHYEFTTPVLLCVACFAVAWLAHRLARFARESQRLAEQRRVDLARLDQLNQRILEDVSDGVLVVDEGGRVHQFNPQAERLIGQFLAPERNLAVLVPELARELACWRDDPHHVPGTTVVQHTKKLVRPRFVALSAGFSGAVLIYLEDMDRLRRESQQVKLAALGRLTANLAHEIRNPLSAISHASQLLSEEFRDPLVDKLTRIIADNTRRLERMVKDVLELNRRDRVQIADINLGEWLRCFLDEFSQVEAIPDAVIAMSCTGGANIRFDPVHLHQVVWNLAGNGWRYCSKRQGSLAFSLRQPAGYWVLDVCNDGPQVAPDAQSQLFEPFFTTDSRGTGLGLYISRVICQANAAQIEYVEPPQGGVCFRITFGMSDGQKTR